MLEGISGEVLSKGVGVTCFALLTCVTVAARRLARRDACSTEVSGDSPRHLIQSQIEEFLSRGVLVVSGALSAKQLVEAREGFRRCLLEYEVPPCSSLVSFTVH